MRFTACEILFEVCCAPCCLDISLNIVLHSICYNLTFSDWVETIFTFLHKLGLVSVGCLKILGVQYFIDSGKVSKIIYCFCEISIYNWFENSFQMKPPFWVWSVSSLIVGLQSNLVFKFALTDFSEKIFLWLIGFFLKWIYQGNLIFATTDIWYPISTSRYLHI